MRRSILTAGCWLLAAGLANAQLPEAAPESVGLDASRLARIDGAVQKAIARKEIPGAVVLIGRRGKIAFVKTYGQRAVEPNPEPMTRDTLFDMASLTKPMATATAIMLLIERGQIRLSDPVSKYIPGYSANGKGRTTIEQLLRHRAGLIPDNALVDYLDGPEKAWQRINALPLQSGLDEKFVYSDVGFLVLGRIVEIVSGKPLDQFVREEIFQPLGMGRSGYQPSKKDTAAPTEKEKGEWLQGIVHDPRARALGGVAGHAGLFSTADDVAIYAQTLLRGGLAPNGHQLLSALTVRAMTDAAGTPSHERRGLGWDVDTSYSAPRGSLFGPNGYGHTGFTGTSLWVDPETDTFVVILSNRLHPSGRGNATPVRAEVATIVASSIVDASPRPSEQPAVSEIRLAQTRPAVREVACGIDVLKRRKFDLLQGKRVALVTNHTGRTIDGESTIDVLFNAPGVRLVTLFSPEHGIRGLVDKEVGDSKDEKTGLPIYSLYGKTRKPTAETLKGVDIIVYDIQDIGTRFYTYISTMGLVLQAARENKLPLIVLDRPNPIGGVAVGGPVRDVDYPSFIAFHALPVRHGMTVGELARMFNKERFVDAELTVVPCEGWRRGDLYDRTGLAWVNPSPNMRSLTEALLYPGIGLLEATNLATGRGTDTPFERVGAPWIEARQWSKALNELNLSGVRFLPNTFSPSERQFKGERCNGVLIMITDVDTFDPIDVGLGMAWTLRKLYPKTWQPKRFLEFLGDRDTYEALITGKPFGPFRQAANADLDAFLEVRSKYLIYR